MSSRLCLLVLITPVLMAADADGDDVKPVPQPAKDRQELDIPRSSDPGKQPFLRNFVRDEWRMWSSPFRRSSYETRTVKKYVIPFALISTALIAADQKTTSALPNTADQEKWSGRISEAGAAYTLAGASGVIYLTGKLAGNKHMRETGWLGIEAVAHSQLVIFGMKQISNRMRPPDESTRRGFWKGGDSFPSGHAATSFAVAAVYSYEYRNHIAVPIVAYSLAGLVSASRVSARRHWVSDIFVGGSSGFLIGRYVYRHHHDPRLPGSSVRRSLASHLMPEIGMGLYGPSLRWNL